MQEVRFYLDAEPRRFPIMPPDAGDAFIFHLQGDKWNDYGYVTLFHATLFKEGQEYSLGAIRILVDEQSSTADALRNFTGYAIADFFVRTSQLFVSLGNSLNYYRALKSNLRPHLRESILQTMHDAAYLQIRTPHSASLELRNTEGFRKSLLRSLSEKQAFEEAAQVIFGRKRRRNRSFDISYDLRGEQPRQSLNFDFSPSRNYPANINLLIGSNGTGKTQALKSIVAAMIDRGFLSEKEQLAVSDLNPRVTSTGGFSHIVAVSYTPFEDFPTARSSVGLASEQYQYCGFRTFENIRGESILQAAPSQLAELHRLDQQSAIKGETSRFETFISAMKDGLDFDELWLTIGSWTSEILWSKREPIMPSHIEFSGESALTFARKGQAVKLSAGQTIFVGLLLSILRYIKQNALLLVDEPELYLHANLEVQLITILRTLLQRYNAFAIIATHSPIMAREVPRQRTWILRRSSDGAINAYRPPFQTFGADLTRIINYVFDDLLLTHPYVAWLQERLVAIGSVENIIDDDMSMELKVLLRSLRRD